MDKIFIGRDNAVVLSLQDNGTAISTTATTAMSIRLGPHLITSTNTVTSISWNQAGYATGEVRLYLGGHATLTTGIYDAYLVTYESTASNGIAWGRIPLNVIGNVLTT